MQGQLSGLSRCRKGKPDDRCRNPVDFRAFTGQAGRMERRPCDQPRRRRDVQVQDDVPRGGREEIQVRCAGNAGRDRPGHWPQPVLAENRRADGKLAGAEVRRIYQQT